MKQILRSLTVGISALALIGCESPPSLLDSGPAAAIPLHTKVIVIPPKITYESISDESPVAGRPSRGPSLESELVAAANEALAGLGVSSMPAPASDAATVSLSQASDQLVSMPAALPWTSTFQTVSAHAASSAILVQYLRVKVGPAGTWDPNTGAITAAMNSSQLRVRLFDAETSHCLWTGGFFIRQYPDLESAAFRDGLAGTYKSLKTQ